MKIRTFTLTAVGVLAGGAVTASLLATGKAPAMPVSAGPQMLDFGRDNPIPFSLINEAARAPILFNNEADMQVRLKNGGTVQIGESDLTFNQANPKKRALQYMAVDVLELKRGAKIITNGTDLVIVANRVVSEDGSIIAFDKNRVAANATTPGGAGQSGADGGSVTLIAINGVEGRVHVDLSGQQGGDGAPGADAANGGAGGKGENAESSPFGCSHGGGGGLPGGNGLNGATGGPSGSGGHGGSFFFYNVGSKPIPVATYDYVSLGAKAGMPGAGGLGGHGGPGGDGGNGSGYCGGGSPGQRGAEGQVGQVGPAGFDAADGNSLVTNLSLELLIKKTHELPLNTPANQ